MAWKGIHLTQPARLSVSNSQIYVTRDDGDITIPLEDIAWIVVDNHRVTLTVSLLAACADHGVAIIVSDTKHMPSSLTLPMNRHHRSAGVGQMQLNAGLPVKKQLWRSIVRAKIINQATVLDRAGIGNTPPISKMACLVRSGDPDNVEARAAREYWTALFENFRRGDDADLRNKALNYAYAVLRGCIARALTASGFMPAIGLHHKSVTNPFNLADDMIEAFRPIADLMVFNHCKTRDPTDDLMLEDRQMLAALPLRDAMVGNDTASILHASEIAAQSLARALQNNDAGELIMPALPKTQPALPGLSE